MTWVTQIPTQQKNDEIPVVKEFVPNKCADSSVAHNEILHPHLNDGDSQRVGNPWIEICSTLDVQGNVYTRDHIPLQNGNIIQQHINPTLSRCSQDVISPSCDDFRRNTMDHQHYFGNPSQVPTAGMLSQQREWHKTIGRDLPKFDGTPENWPEYLNRYTVSTEKCV